MIIAHRIRLVPNKKQERYFYRACGVARFAYNWALAEWERLYMAGEPRSELLLRRKLNAIKDEQFPWMREVTKNAPQQAIKNLGRAYTYYMRSIQQTRRGETTRNHAEMPRFKRRGRRDAFRADNGPCEGRWNAVKISGKRVKLPCIGWIKMREPVRFEGQIISATVSRDADRWYVSLAIRLELAPKKRADGDIAGCDLGITTLATIFDGRQVLKVPGERPLRRLLKKLRRLDKSVARKQVRSHNRAKAKTKLARMHARIRDTRLDHLHKLTTLLTRSYRAIGIEDLNPSGMMRNRFLARAMVDTAFGEIRRQLTYKTHLNCGVLVVADRWFPSSKLCSLCGSLQKRVVWALRSWTCSACGAEHDRDENAARNLYLAASSAVTACGAEGAGRLLRVGETGRYEAGRLAQASRNGQEAAGSRSSLAQNRG